MDTTARQALEALENAMQEKRETAKETLGAMSTEELRATLLNVVLAYAEGTELEMSGSEVLEGIAETLKENGL